MSPILGMEEPQILGMQVLQMRRQSSSWLKLTEHAKKYILEDRQELKPYLSDDGNVMFLLNCVYDVVGAILSGEYAASNQFESHQKVHAETHPYTIKTRAFSKKLLRHVTNH